MQTYEVEVKALLGSPARADEVRAAMRNADLNCKLESRNKQLNHYFVGGDLRKLEEKVFLHLRKEHVAKLNDLVAKAQDFSVRSREKDQKVFLVLKVSVDDTTSANGISRMEFEEQIPLTLEELDKLILSSGFSYQAKWSREREEYKCLGTNVTLDRNAGYGWVAEFERMVQDSAEVDSARNEIRALMSKLNVEELPQDRLARMFDFYNKNWEDYYGTDKIFVVK
ncbi:MAG TPA: CYTH domain-containing protein [Candidatus Paceibacterota bacterium]